MKKTIIILLISLVAAVPFLFGEPNDWFFTIVDANTTSWRVYVEFSDANGVEDTEYDYLLGIGIRGKEYNFTLEEVIEKLIPTDDIVVSEIIRVYDGDTFFCNINQWPPILGKNIGIRVNGIDTPEMRGSTPAVKKLALQAKAIAYDRLTKAKMVVLKNIKRGKYFRVVADVEFDGKDLATELIKMSLAKPYDGGTKDEWDIEDAIIIEDTNVTIENLRFEPKNPLVQ